MDQLRRPWVIACSGPSLAAWISAGLRLVDCAVNDASVLLDCRILSCLDATEGRPYRIPQLGTITRPVSMGDHIARSSTQRIWNCYALSCEKPYFSTEAALRWALCHGHRDIVILGCDLSGDVHVTGDGGALFRPPMVKSSGLTRWQYERRLLAQVWRDARAQGARIERLRHPDQRPELTRSILVR